MFHLWSPKRAAFTALIWILWFARTNRSLDTLLFTPRDLEDSCSDGGYEADILRIPLTETGT